MAGATDPAEALTACGGLIRPTAETPRSDYQDQRVYFCTWACLRAFLDSPDAFMAGELEHPTEEVE